MAKCFALTIAINTVPSSIGIQCLSSALTVFLKRLGLELSSHFLSNGSIAIGNFAFNQFTSVVEIALIVKSPGKKIYSTLQVLVIVKSAEVQQHW